MNDGAPAAVIDGGDDGKRISAPTRRRNRRTALWLALVALGFYVAFFFAVSHRGG